MITGSYSFLLITGSIELALKQVGKSYSFSVIINYYVECYITSFKLSERSCCPHIGKIFIDVNMQFSLDSYIQAIPLTAQECKKEQNLAQLGFCLNHWSLNHAIISLFNQYWEVKQVKLEKL